MKPSDLDPERWWKIDRIFDAALDTAPEHREEFLKRACSGDVDLKRQVEALLEASGRVGDQAGEAVVRLTGTFFEELSERALPEQIGPFRVLREIGRGGMGVVYMAEDTRLGRRVAVKVLPPYPGLGQEAKERFMAEARAVSLLDHPNIATLYGIDETEEGQLFMAFAFYEGETLADHLRRGALSADETVRIGIGVAEGLAAAHRRGVIHRDVKPSNVLLTEEGAVKLLDFGVSKIVGEDLTGEGVRLGTVAYMSPEQLGGSSIDPRTDLWSLGVLLYEALMGERPFQGDSLGSLLQSILRDEPILLQSRGERPLREDKPPDQRLREGLEAIVQKLLSKDPERRHESADKLLQDLRTLDAKGHRPRVSREAPRSMLGMASIWLQRLKVGGSLRHVATVMSFLVAVSVLGGAGWLLVNQPGAKDPIHAVAVLPLANRTGDPAQQHLVDGVHDAVIAELGKVGSLDVISRTSVNRYRESQQSLPEIARELRVDAVLEGSVFRLGDSLVVTTQLLTGSPERRIWTGTFRGEMGGVFQIATEVARAIAVETEVPLSPQENIRLAGTDRVDPAAYEAFTLGQFNLERRSAEGFALAQRYFRRAIEMDSTFANAYAALAETYGSATFFGLEDPAMTMPVIRQLTETALAIDSTLQAAHVVEAAVKLYWDWDWEGAESDLRRAIEINPSYAPGYGVLSEVLAVQGRYQEALEAVERRSELDRMVAFSLFRPVVVLNYMNDFDRAISRAWEGLGFFPEFWQGHWLLCRALAGKGRYEEAVRACEEAVTLSGRTASALSSLGYAHARNGEAGRAREMLQELHVQSETRYVGPSNFAILYAGLGEEDRALEWLERAFQDRDVRMVHVAHLKPFQPLHSDPRFESLLTRMGLNTVLEVGEAEGMAWFTPSRHLFG